MNGYVTCWIKKSRRHPFQVLQCYSILCLQWQNVASKYFKLSMPKCSPACHNPLSTNTCDLRDARSLHWRHNGHDSFSNHHPHDCLLNCLFRRRSKKMSKLRVTSLCAGNSVNSPHKWPVTRKMFPFDDVIMCRVFWKGIRIIRKQLIGTMIDSMPSPWTLLYKLRSLPNTGTSYPGQGWFVRNLGWGR